MLVIARIAIDPSRRAGDSRPVFAPRTATAAFSTVVALAALAVPGALPAAASTAAVPSAASTGASLIALGVDGFRWDSAKEMDPADIAAIEALLTKPVFIYQDVEYGAGQPVTPDLYEGTGSVEEYRYGWDLYDAFTSGTLASLSDFGPSWNSAGMVPSADAVAFVDTQDTERDGGALYYADGASYILANVFTLAWDYGTPMVLSDYAFSGYDQGPPGGGGNSIATPSCGTGTWQCEERWPAIAGMVGWHNAAGAALFDFLEDALHLV